MSGAAITVSLTLTRRLGERGLGVDAITAARYPTIVAMALVALLAGSGEGAIPTGARLLEVVVMACVLVALPLYVLQLGIASTGALTGHVIRALAPVFVFGLELVDQRIAYSLPVLACIVAYSAFAIGANVSRIVAAARRVPHPVRAT